MVFSWLSFHFQISRSVVDFALLRMIWKWNFLSKRLNEKKPPSLAVFLEFGLLLSRVLSADPPPLGWSS